MVIVKYDSEIISSDRRWVRENSERSNSVGDGRNQDKSLVMVFRYVELAPLSTCSVISMRLIVGGY